MHKLLVDISHQHVVPALANLAAQLIDQCRFYLVWTVGHTKGDGVRGVRASRTYTAKSAASHT